MVEKGKKNDNVHIDCSAQPSIKCIKIRFSELGICNDILHCYSWENRGIERTKSPVQITEIESCRAGICTQLISLHSDTNNDNTVTGLWSKIDPQKEISPVSLRMNMTNSLLESCHATWLRIIIDTKWILTPCCSLSFPLMRYSNSPSAVKSSLLV